MTPETKARQRIDDKLTQAGWVIQDLKQLNLSAGVGVAVREYPTDTGPADYVLFVNRVACGVIEAKKDAAGENLTVVEEQSARYAAANLKWHQQQTPLRFLFEATGQIIRFADAADHGVFPFASPREAVVSFDITTTVRGDISCRKSLPFFLLRPRLRVACKTPVRAGLPARSPLPTSKPVPNN